MSVAIIDIVGVTAMTQTPIVQTCLADNFTTTGALAESFARAPVVLLTTRKMIVVHTIL